jgi:hypothetical protein
VYFKHTGSHEKSPLKQILQILKAFPFRKVVAIESKINGPLYL